MTQPTDSQIAFALIHQVTKAVPATCGANEQSVRTIITRPMWKAWCRFTVSPENSEPTAWLGKKTLRVYGSETIVVESDVMQSVSFAKP